METIMGVLWTQGEDQMLRDMAKQGLSTSRIAVAINRKFKHSRSRNAIIGRAGRIGVELAPQNQYGRRRAVQATIRVVPDDDDYAESLALGALLSRAPNDRFALEDIAAIREVALEWPDATVSDLAKATMYSVALVKRAVPDRPIGGGGKRKDIAAIRAGLRQSA
jgi:hypothetical protein